MDCGANQHDIIFRLIKTQPLSLLKLWGRVMAGLKWDEHRELIWANVTPEDIVQSRSRAEDLPLILEKIRGHSSVGKFFMILSPESPSRVCAILKSPTPDFLAELARSFPDSTFRGDTLSISLPARSLEEAEVAMLEKIPPL